MNSTIVSDEYCKATKEVLKILEILPTEKVNKVPKKLLEFFEEVADKDYIPDLDCSNNLSKLKLMKKTTNILAMLYRNYWCSEEEKVQFDKLLIENEKKYQEMLHEKYNVDNLFSQKKNIKDNSNENISLTVIHSKKENIVKRFFAFIKRCIIKN